MLVKAMVRVRSDGESDDESESESKSEGESQGESQGDLWSASRHDLSSSVLPVTTCWKCLAVPKSTILT